MLKILVKLGDSQEAELSFTQEDEVAIGSGEGCGVRLPNSVACSRQAVITPTEGGQWFVENLEPVREVMLNETPLTSRIELGHEDQIALDDYRLEILIETEEVDEGLTGELDLSAEELAKIKHYPLPHGSLVRLQTDPVELDRVQQYNIAEDAAAIATAQDLHQLVEIGLDVLLSRFAARAAWIGIRQQLRGELDIQGGKLTTGQPAEKNAIIELLHYRCVTRRQHVLIRRVRDQESITTAMAVPLVIRNGTLGMVYVDRGQRASRLRTQDLDMLSTISTHMTAKLNDLLSGEAQRSAQTTAAEIGVVHAIQEHLDPKAAHNYQGLQVAAYSRAGQENPGDVYDVMQHPDTGVTAFMLGHVNGGGALLALSMARLQSTFRVGFLHNDPPHALARALNWLMFSEQDPTCVDALFFLVDPKSGKFRYARAGKIGGFIVDPNGQPRALENATAPSIGEVANFQYPTVSGQFLPGETLAMYTRGTATCTSADGQRFGEHRFIEAVCDGFGQSPTTTLQDLTCELTAFFDGGTQPDDISIVLIHREA